MEVPKKINENPGGIDHKDPQEIHNKDHPIPFYLVPMIATTIYRFAMAYRHKDNDYSWPVFNLVVFFTFLLTGYCLPRYDALPKNEKSSRKFWLKLSIWFLVTSLSSGFVYLFAHLYLWGFQITVVVYTIVFVCSAFLIYAFILVDVLNNRKNRDEINGRH